MLTRKHQISLKLQTLLSYCNLIWFIPPFVVYLKYIMRYQIDNLDEFRRKVDRLRAENPGQSIIIAANHLTLIDSLLIIWAICDVKSFIFRFNLFPWNVPEFDNFGRNPLTKLMCYLGKCVYIQRQGKTSEKALTLAKLDFLLKSGQTICIFPEGGRSRTGKIDCENATYGIGKMIDENPEASVWCLYLRGKRQKAFSNFPARKEHFYLDLSPITPTSLATGRRKHRELTMQVMEELEILEENYFDFRQRHRRPTQQYSAPAIRQSHH